jgi:hypothetical protein
MADIEGGAERGVRPPEIRVGRIDGKGTQFRSTRSITELPGGYSAQGDQGIAYDDASCLAGEVATELRVMGLPAIRAGRRFAASEASHDGSFVLDAAEDAVRAALAQLREQTEPRP